jgi:hypothetical protein
MSQSTSNTASTIGGCKSVKLDALMAVPIDSMSDLYTFVSVYIHQVMRPGQLSQQCRDFFVAAISFIKLPHPEQRRARKSPCIWLMPL